MQQIQNSLTILGDILKASGEGRFGHLEKKNQRIAKQLEPLIESAVNENHWFTENNTRFAFLANAQMLKKIPDSEISAKQSNGKTLAIVPPALAPLDGLKDMAIALLMGYAIEYKRMFKDEKLMPAIINALKEIQSNLKSRIIFRKDQLKNIDRIIVTIPADRYDQWEKYFSKYPGKIRRPAYGAAIITGKETLNQLEALGNDIFRYFGRTFNNVYKLYLPEKYPLSLFEEAFEPFSLEMKYHTQYYNNFEYNKSIYLINAENNVDNGFLIFKEDTSLESRIAMLHFERYNNQQALEAKLKRDQEKLSKVVCIKDQKLITTIQPGHSVRPSLNDDDAKDTLKKINL